MQDIVATISDVESSKFIAFFERGVTTLYQRHLQDRNRLICLLMLDAGLRVGEVVKVCVGDLIVGGSVVSMLLVNDRIAVKGAKRDLPLTSRLHDAVQLCNLNIWQPSLLSMCASAFVFDSSSSVVTVRQIERMVAQVSLLSFGRSIHPHVLRHTFATRLMRQTNEKIVQQLLGHSSLMSTQIYTHVNTGDLQEAVRSIQ